MAEENKYLIYDFWADWCGPCKVQKNEFKTNQDKLPIKVIFTDCDDPINQKLIEVYKIKSLPTLVLVDNNGNEIKRWIGLTKVNKINEYEKAVLKNPKSDIIEQLVEYKELYKEMENDNSNLVFIRCFTDDITKGYSDFSKVLCNIT